MNSEEENEALLCSLAEKDYVQERRVQRNAVCGESARTV